MRTLRTLPRVVAALALLAAAAGCDSTGSDGADEMSNLEAAVAVANGTAVQPGGALESVAGALRDGSALHGEGCSAERTYDPATQTWTSIVDCERGDPDDRFYARFGRTRTVRFFDSAGTPQQFPEGAASLDFAIVDGYGEVRTPWLRHELLDIGAALDVDDLLLDLVTINGTYDRAATDTLFVRRRGGPAAVRRTLIYDLDLEFVDVRARGRGAGHPGRPVSGTVNGHIEGTATFTRRDGTVVTRDFDRTFTIVFGGQPDAETAEIRIGADSFLANMETGEVAGTE